MNIQLMSDQSGFEILEEDVQVGHIVWELQDDVMIMNGTFVDPSLRGKNAGLELLNAAANFARQHQYKMKAVCPYIVKMFERSADYDDVKV